MDHRESRVGIDEVIRILGLIAGQPNARRFPRPGDIEGNYDQWFDGGAWRANTGGPTEFHFAGGDRASVDPPFGGRAIRIVLKDGRKAKIDLAWKGE